MKKLLFIVLSLLIILSLISFVGCKKKKPATEVSTESSSASKSVSIIEYKAVDRSNYNFENLKSLYSPYSVSELSEMLKDDKIFTVAKGYMLGDIFNIVLDKANTAFPNGSNIGKIYGFSLYEDGFWYNNFTKKKTHIIMNKLLGYRFDKGESLKITQSELSVYGDSKIIDFCGYTASASEILKAYPLVPYLLNATLSDWYYFLDGDFSYKVLNAKSLVGDTEVDDIMKFFGADIKVKIPLTTLLSHFAVSSSVTKNQLIGLELLRSCQSVNPQEPFFKKTITANGLNYTIGTAINQIFDVTSISNDDNKTIQSVGLKKHISDINNAIIDLYADELQTLLDNFAAQQTNSVDIASASIDEIMTSVNNSTSKESATLSFIYRITNYYETLDLSTEKGDLTIDDIIVYIADYFNGLDTYKSLTAKQLSLFVKGLVEGKLHSFAKITIESNKQLIMQEIENYNAVHTENATNLTYESILEIAQSDSFDKTTLSGADNDFLAQVTVQSILDFNGQVLPEIKDESASSFLNECLSISLYDLLFGVSQEKTQSIKDKIGVINPLNLYNSLKA